MKLDLMNQDELLNKLSNIKIGKKTTKQKGVINNITRFYNSREETNNFCRDYGKMILDAVHKSNKMKLREKALRY